MRPFWSLGVSAALAVAVARADDYTANWMGRVSATLVDSTLLDLSLAGSHDTMTYDLSGTVSDGGIDDYPELAAILNSFSGVIPDNVASFMHAQAQTQGLNVTAQLDAGLRFLDFRIMYTSGDWYCLHMLQTNRPALEYLAEVRRASAVFNTLAPMGHVAMIMGSWRKSVCDTSRCARGSTPTRASCS